MLTSSTINTTPEVLKKWNIDTAHTNINFTVSHMVISEVTGTFKEFSAVMESAKEDFTEAKITVEIKAKSIDTGSNGRDNHLQGPDFFNAAVDSIITFRSSSIEKKETDNYVIHGLLTMRGVTKEISLDTKNPGHTGRCVPDYF